MKNCEICMRPLEDQSQKWHPECPALMLEWLLPWSIGAKNLLNEVSDMGSPIYKHHAEKIGVLYDKMLDEMEGQ